LTISCATRLGCVRYGNRRALAAPISAPVVEEIAKALGVLLIFRLLRAEFDNVRDGFVYGAVVGVGFNWSEAAIIAASGPSTIATAGCRATQASINWKNAVLNGKASAVARPRSAYRLPSSWPYGATPD
jgi:RsiW-degrading membrane proteinase PrsW (M82 family)